MLEGSSWSQCLWFSGKGVIFSSFIPSLTKVTSGYWLHNFEIKRKPYANRITAAIFTATKNVCKVETAPSLVFFFNVYCAGTPFHGMLLHELD